VTVFTALAFRVEALPQAPVSATTVCEITQHPERFIGQRVSLDASVESDGIERSVLVDDRDKKCKRGLVPTTDPNSKKSEAANELLIQAIFNGHPGTIDKKITGHFVGVVSMRKPEDFMMAPGTQVIVLTVESIKNLQVHQLP
jgi:hypothetical protein